MDQRILQVLKATAIERIEEVSYGTELRCVFCLSGDTIYHTESDSIKHQPGCDTLVARDVLREWGQPMSEYHVTCEQRIDKYSAWRLCNDYRQGYMKQDIRSAYETKKGGYPQYRNVQIEKVREL